MEKLFFDRLLFVFALKPILMGFAGMAVAGLSFPLAGVIVLRNGLIPLRFMLMHGVLLAGVLSVAFGFPMLLSAILINLVLVVLIVAFKKQARNLGASSSAVMVLAMAGASLLAHALDVPAKDTLDLLWGSPFAMSFSDLAVLFAVSAILVLYCLTQYRKITAVFFDSDVALSVGVNIRLHHIAMIALTALVIAVSMRIMGALLLDSLLILPVLSVSGSSCSVRSLFVRSAACGFAISLAGYPIAVMADLPVSGVVSALAVLVYSVFRLAKARQVAHQVRVRR